jgi:hypothetical protein
MAEKSRVNVTLDEEHATKLTRLAERTQIHEGTLARSLLSQALDEADLDARNVVDLLDGIPGAFDSAREGLEQARTRRTVALDDL